ncbi:MAG: gliding motility-associated C-terminal domain-containing protein [Chitinophagaceae bacterium]
MKRKIRVSFFLTLTFISFLKTAGAAEINIPSIYKGIGNTYAEETQTIFISAATLVQGSNFRFTSRNLNDLQFSGNNVEGFIQYEDALNNTIKLFGIASRPEKSGGNFRAVYVYVADSTNSNAPTGEAYLIIFPGYTSLFPGTGEIGTSSDPVDNVLNSFLPAISPGSIGNDQSICAGLNPNAFVSLSNGTSTSSAVSYQWESSTDNTNFSEINGATASTYTSGSLTVTTYFRRKATDINNNIAYSNTVTVTVNALPTTPTITAGGPTTFCAGGSVVLTSSSATGNTWSTGATTQSITVTTSGTYTVAVTTAGCTSATSAGTTVTVNPIPATPTISAGGSTTFCAGGSVVLTSSSASGNVWSTGATTQSITVSTSGTYTVAVTTAGCTSATSAATTVTVNALPSTPTITSGGPVTFCSGGSVTLSATAGATSYRWFKDGTLISGATAAAYTVTQSGAYTVTATNASNCTSASSAATTGTVNALPSTPTITSGGPVTFCSGGSVTLSATAGATSYRWFKDGTLISGATAATYTVTESGLYTTIVTNASNCSSPSSAATIVTVNIPPAAPGTISGITETFPTRTHTYSVAPVTGATSYLWMLPNGWTGSSTTNTIQITAGNTNGILSVAAISNGCISPSASLTLKVNLFIADVITPNGDGYNENWIIMRPSNFRIGVTIYNRWGQVVFKDTDYQNSFNGIGTGNFLGKQLPSGTYFYIVDIFDRLGTSKKVQQGYLTLKREN